MDRALREIQDGIDVDMNLHMGGNVHATLTSPYECVNVHYWFMKDEKLRPGRGVSLRVPEWKELCLADKQLDDNVPELATTVECMQQEDHQNLMGMLACQECHPNDWDRY